MRAAPLVGKQGLPRFALFPGSRVYLGGRRLSKANLCQCARSIGGNGLPQVISNFSPHETLGVAQDAGMKEIKRAFRKLALKHHPDREGGSEANFLLVVEAYEILTGKRAGKDSPRKDSWDYHDWFWKFAINRRKGGKVAGNRRESFCDQSQMRSQLAGLRHRSAVRGIKRSSPTDPSTVDSPDAAIVDDGSLSEESASFESDNLESIESADFFDSSDCPSDAASMPVSPEASDALSGRAQEETRRRVALNGTDAKDSVNGQLLGLRRKAKLNPKSTDGCDWAYL